MTETFRDPSVQALLDLARPEQHDAVLDYACGIGITTLAIAPAVASVLAVDEVAATLDEGRRLVAELGLDNVTFKVVDLYTLPFADAEFSLVVSRGALHRLPEPERGAARAAPCRRRGRPYRRGGRRRRRRDRRRPSTTWRACASRPTGATSVPRSSRLWRSPRVSASSSAARCGAPSNLDYWMQAAAVPSEKSELIRARVQALPVGVQQSLDVVFADRLVSFSTDVLALHLEAV